MDLELQPIIMFTDPIAAIAGHDQVPWIVGTSLALGYDVFKGGGVHPALFANTVLSTGMATPSLPFSTAFPSALFYRQLGYGRILGHG